jgi:predicted LPLAT superfamily acyltransferase
LADWIRVFADRLERQVRGAPLNWFNFYDFWPG